MCIRDSKYNYYTELQATINTTTTTTKATLNHATTTVHPYQRRPTHTHPYIKVINQILKLTIYTVGQIVCMITVTT